MSNRRPARKLAALRSWPAYTYIYIYIYTYIYSYIHINTYIICYSILNCIVLQYITLRYAEQAALAFIASLDSDVLEAAKAAAEHL